MKTKSYHIAIVTILATLISSIYGQEGETLIDTLDAGYLAFPLPPVYSNAITYKGFTIGGGVGYQNIGHPTRYTEYYIDYENDTGYVTDRWYTYDPFHAIRPGIHITYGFTPWLAGVGRGGMLIDFDGITTPIGGIGVKLSTPWHKYACGSLILEADYPHLVLLTLMVGGVTPKGRELVTLGLQTHLFDLSPVWDKPHHIDQCQGGYAFINVHPLPGMHITAGLASYYSPGIFFSDGCGMYAGMGYTYNIAPRTTRIRKVIIIEEETYTD